MKIAITADLHLTTRKDHPERFQALENILQQMTKHKIDTIIIAGDLFDVESRNYAELDALCKHEKYKNIQFYIIPGNHDARIKSAMFAAENVTIFSEPKIHTFDTTGLPFLFLPYEKDKTMGDEIASSISELPSHEWILIGHGDWVEGMRDSNPLEPGVYMPLTRTDIESYRPLQVVLGHIHKPTDTETLHYPGSPSPLDITETGKRGFLVADTETGTVQPQTLESVIIYFDESFFVLPLEDENAYLKSQIESRIKIWNLTEEQKARVQIRVKVRGYTTNKQALAQVLRQGLVGFRFYKDEDPDLSDVFISADTERAEIANRVAKVIDNLERAQGEQQPKKEQILLEALHVIYGD